MAVKRVGMFGVTVRKALNVKMETVKLSGKCRQNVTCWVYVNGMKIIKGIFYPKTDHTGPEGE
jgi:hypothetical protein